MANTNNSLAGPLPRRSAPGAWCQRSGSPPWAPAYSARIRPRRRSGAHRRL